MSGKPAHIILADKAQFSRTTRWAPYEILHEPIDLITEWTEEGSGLHNVGKDSHKDIWLKLGDQPWTSCNGPRSLEMNYVY